MSRIFIDCFSGALADLPKGTRTAENALRVLVGHPRVSTFDRGPAWLESLLSDLKSKGLIVEDRNEPYPWCRFVLTEAGKDAIK